MLQYDSLSYFQNIHDFENLFKLQIYDKKLKYKHQKLLNLLLNTPCITTYDIFQTRQSEYKDKSYVRRYLKFLLKLKLVEYCQAKTDKNKKAKTDSKHNKIN